MSEYFLKHCDFYNEQYQNTSEINRADRCHYNPFNQ